MLQNIKKIKYRFVKKNIFTNNSLAFILYDENKIKTKSETR